MAKPARLANEKVLPKVRSLAESVAGPLGARVVDVDFVEEDGYRTLRVIVAKEGQEGNTGVDTCEKVNRALSKELDTLEHMLPDSYFLEVSSPGIQIESPLRKLPAAEPASRKRRPTKPGPDASSPRPGPGKEELS